MAPPLRTPRHAWVDAGMQALAAGGPGAVRVDRLAGGLGVSRGGFYWHFTDRKALLEAILDRWEQRATEEVLARVEQEGGDPRTRLLRAGALTFSDELLPVDLAVRDWARRDAAVAARLERVDSRRMAYLRTQFAAFCPGDEEVEARATLAFALAIGHHFMAAEHPGRSRADALRLAVAHLLA